MFFAPVDFQPTRRRSLQPDLLVVRRQDVGPANITLPLLLAVEVLSPSTRSKDLLLKRGVYEDSRVPSYWVVDPDGPSMLVLELATDGHYREVTELHGEQAARIAQPFAITVRPTDLLAG